MSIFPQDSIKGQIAVGTDGSINWFNGTEWQTKVGIPSGGNPPQDAVNGQIAIGSDHSLNWCVNDTWYGAPGTPATGNAPQDAVQGQLVLGVGAPCWFDEGQWWTFALFTPPPAPSGLYVANRDPSSNLYRIDPVTGTLTTIGPIEFGIQGMAFDPITTSLYAVTTDSSQKLIIIDPNIGTGFLVNDIVSSGPFAEDIAFDANGNLFGWNSGNRLVSINKSTAVFTVVGGTGTTFENGTGLDFAPNGLGYFFRDGANGTLSVVDPSTGVWHTIPDGFGPPHMDGTGFSNDAIVAASFRDGLFWCLTHDTVSINNSRFITVDTTTGTTLGYYNVDVIATLNNKTYDGIAWAPELSTAYRPVFIGECIRGHGNGGPTTTTITFNRTVRVGSYIVLWIAYNDVVGSPPSVVDHITDNRGNVWPNAINAISKFGDVDGYDEIYYMQVTTTLFSTDNLTLHWTDYSETPTSAPAAWAIVGAAFANLDEGNGHGISFVDYIASVGITPNGSPQRSTTPNSFGNGVMMGGILANMDMAQFGVNFGSFPSANTNVGPTSGTYDTSVLSWQTLPNETYVNVGAGIGVGLWPSFAILPSAATDLNPITTPISVLWSGSFYSGSDGKWPWESIAFWIGPTI
jgi:hypothetical protein